MISTLIHSIDDIPAVESCGEGKLDWIIDGILLEGAVHLVTGDAGAGKSTLISAAGQAVAEGGTFLGRRCRQRRVLIVDAENPQAVVQERFDRLGIRSGTDLLVWGAWIQPEPAGPESRLIIDWITAADAKPLIIFDSYAALYEGNENDSAETRRFMQRFRNLATMGATVVVLHHTGKAESAQQFRGSSDIKAAVDLAFLVKRLGQDDMLSRLEVTPFKQRVTVNIPRSLRFDDGKFVAEIQGDPNAANKFLLRKLIMENPMVTARKLDELAKRLRIPRSVAREQIDQWVDEGTVAVHDGDKGQKLHFWVGELEAGVEATN